jgi:hypothetical protein
MRGERRGRVNAYTYTRTWFILSHLDVVGVRYLITIDADDDKKTGLVGLCDRASGEEIVVSKTEVVTVVSQLLFGVRPWSVIRQAFPAPYKDRCHSDDVPTNPTSHGVEVTSVQSMGAETKDMQKPRAT